MQPAYYENLEEIKNKYWSMLEDAVTNQVHLLNSCIHMFGKSQIDGRIVV